MAEKPTLDTSFSIADDGDDMALLLKDDGTPEREETKTASAASTACSRKTAESPSSLAD